MSDLDQALSLLTMASKDLAALRALAPLEAVADEIFGFHAQQVAEKALKAWLAVLGVRYSFRHDLAELLHMLSQLGQPIEGYWELTAYTDFAVRYRYEVLDTSEPPLEREKVLIQVTELFELVSQLAADRRAHNM